MGGTYDLVKLPKLRKLIGDNTVSRTAYEQFIIQQWENHKIDERSQALYHRAIKGTFSALDLILLNNIDKQITEILLGAEQRCSTKIVERDKRSPIFLVQEALWTYESPSITGTEHDSRHYRAHCSYGCYNKKAFRQVVAMYTSYVG